VPATNTPIVPRTNTPIVPRTNTPIVPATVTPGAPATTSPQPILPVTGVRPAVGPRQLLAAGLGFLGLGLVLSGFALRRKRGM
jgi:hypothetical protein